jgi:hypothetical protein
MKTRPSTVQKRPSTVEKRPIRTTSESRRIGLAGLALVVMVALVVITDAPVSRGGREREKSGGGKYRSKSLFFFCFANTS